MTPWPTPLDAALLQAQENSRNLAKMVFDLEEKLMESERKRMEQHNYINWKLRELEQANARIRELTWDQSPDRMGS